MKRAIISLTLLICFISSWAQTSVTWNDPVMLSHPVMKFTKVEFTDSATIVSLHVSLHINQTNFGFPRSTKLVADGKDYAVKAFSYAPLDSGVPMPESGELDCTLTFTPLPSATKSFSFAIQGNVLFYDVHDRILSRDGIKDTYWRDDTTGDWLLGITEKNLVYDSRIWDISSMSEKKGEYTITATANGEQIALTLGKEKNSQRTITIGKQKHLCSVINTSCLPFYPQKDLRPDLADNHYRKGDSVTIVGWIKDIPETLRKRLTEFSLRYTTIFRSGDFTPSAKIDSLGRFTLRIPVENSTYCYPTNMMANRVFVLEPNETYFLLYDVRNGQTLFMGRESRILNEVSNVLNENGLNVIYPKKISHRDVKDFDPMTFYAMNDSICRGAMNRLEQVCADHPTLSARCKAFLQNVILADVAGTLLQGRFAMPSPYIAPDDYIKAVTDNYLNKIHPPYTTCERFNGVLRDYFGSIEAQVERSGASPIKSVMYSADKDGIITLTDADKEAIDRYVAEVETLTATLANTTDSVEVKRLTDAFNATDFVKRINAIFEKTGFREYYVRKLDTRSILLMLEKMKALGWHQDLQDLYLSEKLCWYIDWQRKPLSRDMLAICDDNVQSEAIRDCIHALNAQYEAIGRRDIVDGNLKSSDIVKDMSEGGQIFRKLVEPYRGKIILIDVWGTWCSPCKAALEHSQEEYERLKPYDMIFMYLASDSPDESWKNVIKEYGVTGDNVVHYNLPREQQRAVENYIQINGYPTYKLVDQNGNLLDVNADPRQLDALEGLVKRMKGGGK